MNKCECSECKTTQRDSDCRPTLSSYTDLELLRELLKRGKLAPAAKRTTRCTPHHSKLIGIGADHIADITIADDALVELMLGE